MVGAVNAVARVLAPELQQALRSDGADILCNVFVAGPEAGRVMLGAFLADPDGAGGLRTLSGVLDGPRYQHGASVTDGPVIDLLRDPVPPWVQPGTAAVARRIITEQIRATPDLVGGPIDVLEVTRAGARWHSGGTA
jgi:hypothetical protein